MSDYPGNYGGSAPYNLPYNQAIQPHTHGHHLHVNTQQPLSPQSQPPAPAASSNTIVDYNQYIQGQQGQGQNGGIPQVIAGQTVHVVPHGVYNVTVTCFMDSIENTLNSLKDIKQQQTNNA
jgi:hypothetical protein